MILTIKTDQTQAEIGLFSENGQQLAYKTWQAHRELAETIHKVLQEQLSKCQKTLEDITGISVYQGPGSFTGLRVGMSVANALAYSLGAPVAASSGLDWLQTGLKKAQSTKPGAYITPVYGTDAHTTRQKK